ncbi:MAG: TPM domain-containing protein [Clostridia bacterium]|nr:TPM domain-containing protein [Clostridia bacterium]
MMKRILSILAVAFIIVANMAVFAFAADTEGFKANHPARVVDEANIIPDGEEKEIQTLLDQISEKRKMDVIVLTVEDIGETPPVVYSGDYFEQHGYGYGENRDGIILFIAMNSRDIFVNSTGKGEKIITEEEGNLLIDTFYDDLVAGNYASACKTFATETDSLIKSFNLRAVFLAPISMIVGLIGSLGKVSGLKSKHETVRFKPKASNYQVEGSLNLITKTDDFLYNNISRAPIVIESRGSSSGGASYTSSSGTHFSGVGRKF